MQRRPSRSRRDLIRGRAETLSASLGTDARRPAGQTWVVSIGPLRLKHVGHEEKLRVTSDEPRRYW